MKNVAKNKQTKKLHTEIHQTQSLYNSVHFYAVRVPASQGIVYFCCITYFCEHVYHEKEKKLTELELEKELFLHFFL